MRVLLTDRFCSTVKTGKVQADFFDETVQGLCLRVTKGGHRSWCFHFRSPRDDKRARVTLGTYPATSLAAARGKAIEARQQVEAGDDPRILTAAQSSAAMTVGALIDAYLSDPERAALRSKAEIDRRLRRNVVPKIGDVKLSELRRRDVKNVTDPMLRRGVKSEAVLVHQDVMSMVRWAVEQEYLDVNPLDGMGKPAELTASDRVLSDDEISAVWNAPFKYQTIIRLCLATSQRVGEVSGMTSAELDLKAREWRLPGARTKNAHPHIVPLSDLALDLIGDKTRGRIFPKATAVDVAREIFKAHAANRFGTASWSAHDLRRTALTGMAKLGVAPMVLGNIANHRSLTKGGVTFAHYVQHSYEAEKRHALDLWADRLTAITQGTASKVLPLRPAS